ncbi:MAG: FecR family protein [Panacagrimonas sp.]
MRLAGGVGLLLSCVLTTAVLAADPAAEINLITGKGTASSADGDVRPLTRGSPVFSGEVVSSGPNSYVNLKFSDGAFVLVRPNSRFQVEEYDFKGQAPTSTEAPAPVLTPVKPVVPLEPAPSSPAPSRAFLRLLKGGFRAVSGVIGKVDRTEYRMAAPVATIGIRGTDYTAVICDAACAADPVIRSEITDQPGLVAEGGLVVGVIEGRVAVDSGGRNCDKPGETGACELVPPQYLLVTADGTQIRLDRAPRFLEVDPTPNPATCAP